MATSIRSPDIRHILTPLLPALPAAALSRQPAPAILPFLSPILRQRVKLLSSASTEPWLRLLSYDPAKELRFNEVARSDRLEPHPVSGEVEVDWDHDVRIQYKRLDKETLQALVVFQELDLFFRLVYCVNDQEGGGDGWRIGEISVPDKTSPFHPFAGYLTIEAAEKGFQETTARPNTLAGKQAPPALDGDEDDDDDYWARYDATPARTPQVKRSPAPASVESTQPNTHPFRKASSEADDAYFAQYDSVQPAMDNHDPDEARHADVVAPPLGLRYPTDSSRHSRSDKGPEEADANETNGGWTLAPSPGARLQEDEERTASLAHPRPASSASSNGSMTVEKLELQAGRQEQSQFGVKQHVSRSIRSLFVLSRAAGIDREEFENLVKTELDVLGVVEERI